MDIAHCTANLKVTEQSCYLRDFHHWPTWSSGNRSGTILFCQVTNILIVSSSNMMFTRRTKVSRMYFFILHLSVADILTAFFTLLTELIWTFTAPRFYGGNILCKTLKFTQTLGPYLSSYTLVMTAFDRYQVIWCSITITPALLLTI